MNSDIIHGYVKISKDKFKQLYSLALEYKEKYVDDELNDISERMMTENLKYKNSFWKSKLYNENLNSLNATKEHITANKQNFSWDNCYGYPNKFYYQYYGKLYMWKNLYDEFNYIDTSFDAAAEDSILVSTYILDRLNNFASSEV